MGSILCQAGTNQIHAGTCGSDYSLHQIKVLAGAGGTLKRRRADHVREPWTTSLTTPNVSRLSPMPIAVGLPRRSIESGHALTGSGAAKELASSSRRRFMTIPPGTIVRFSQPLNRAGQPQRGRDAPINGHGRQPPPRCRSRIGPGPLLYSWVRRCAGHGPGNRRSDPVATVARLSRRART
jgi:hypothetical protein